MRRTSLGCFVVIFLLSLASAPSSATQFERRSLDQLGADAGLVVRGQVRAVRTFWNDAHTRILTEVTVAVTENFKGRSSSEVRVIQMGGELDGMRMTVSGSLAWSQGEDVVLFLEDSLPGRYRVSGFTQGRFDVETSARGGEVFLRRGDEERITLRRMLGRALPSRYEGE